MGKVKFRVKELKGADPLKRVKNFDLQELIYIKDDTDESDDETGTKFKLPCSFKVKGHDKVIRKYSFIYLKKHEL